MIVLVLNCGSSSIKYQLRSMGQTPKLLCKGILERVGSSDAVLEHAPVEAGQRRRIIAAVPDHATGIDLILSLLVDAEVGVLKSLSEITAAGHRVAHGGSFFAQSALVTPEVEERIDSCCDLAPLHNPANLLGIRTLRKLLPSLPQVAVFDTAFHQTLPAEAYTYALPHELLAKYGIRKYGFHGTSHRYVAQLAGRAMQRPWDSLRLITCHLGNGASVTAIRNGQSIDTSMGFTPVDGLIMGTRTGDIDPGALFHLAEKEGLSIEQLAELVNRRSGLKGLSGVSGDMRELTAAERGGNALAALARQAFVYRIRKYIGAYYAALEGLDAIVFTGGIGENDAQIRQMVAQHLGYLGAELDLQANSEARGEACISLPSSRVALWVLPTDEELVIALDTQTLVSTA